MKPRQNGACRAESWAGSRSQTEICCRAKSCTKKSCQRAPSRTGRATDLSQGTRPRCHAPATSQGCWQDFRESSEKSWQLWLLAPRSAGEEGARGSLRKPRAWSPHLAGQDHKAGVRRGREEESRGVWGSQLFCTGQPGAPPALRLVSEAIALSCFNFRLPLGTGVSLIWPRYFLNNKLHATTAAFWLTSYFPGFVLLFKPFLLVNKVCLHTAKQPLSPVQSHLEGEGLVRTILEFLNFLLFPVQTQRERAERREAQRGGRLLT